MTGPLADHRAYACIRASAPNTDVEAGVRPE